MGFLKLWKRDDLGRLIAETKSAFEIDDLSQKIQVLTLNLSGNNHTDFSNEETVMGQERYFN